MKVKRFRFYHYRAREDEAPIGVIIFPKGCHIYYTPGTPKKHLKDLVLRNPYHAPGELILHLRWFYYLRTGLPSNAPVRFFQVPYCMFNSKGEFLHPIEKYFPPIQEVGENWNHYNINDSKTWPINR